MAATDHGATPRVAPRIWAISPDCDDRISWGAIFAGFVCAIALQALFSLFGLAWGFAEIDPAEAPGGWDALTLGGGVYWIITSVISVFAGGWIAGRVSGVPFTPAAIVHGLSVWALATIFALYLASSAIGTAARGAAEVVESAAALGSTAVGEAAEGVQAASGPVGQRLEDAMRRRDITEEGIRDQAREMYRDVVSRSEAETVTEIAEETAEAIVRTPGDAAADIELGLDRLFGDGDTFSGEDRDELIGVIAREFGVSQEEAERIVARWETRWDEAGERVEALYAEARAEAAEMSEAAAEAAAKVSISIFIASFLGLLAGALGGALGRIDPRFW